MDPRQNLSGLGRYKKKRASVNHIFYILNMTKDHFIIRTCCPACKSTSHNIIYACDFSVPPVRDYIQSFYAPQGGVELKYLEGSTFKLRDCGDCGLIYQEEIPNEFLSQKLYEEWIDPEIALKQHLDSKDLDYYSGYAQEIMMLITYIKAIPSRLKFFDFVVENNFVRIAVPFITMAIIAIICFIRINSH